MAADVEKGAFADPVAGFLVDSAHWEQAAGTPENLVLKTLIIPVICLDTPLLFCLNPLTFDSLNLWFCVPTSESCFSSLYQNWISSSFWLSSLTLTVRTFSKHLGCDFAFTHLQLHKRSVSSLVYAGWTGAWPSCIGRVGNNVPYSDRLLQWKTIHTFLPGS